MSPRNIARILGVAATMAWALSALVGTPHASAGACADVEVVSARGTDEPPGPGSVGQAFIDSLTSKVPSRSFEVYGVNFPATNDLVRSSSAGADDARAHVQLTVANCPNTAIVLDGYSQGAYVIDMVTEELQPEVADHVAAVAVFGNPKSTLSSTNVGGQLHSLSPLYRAKTIDLCFPDDPICSEGKNSDAHQQYIHSGMTDQAATFVAGKL
jgi:cutinase